MDAVDPLCAISSPARLLPLTLGPAPATSPSKAREVLLEAIARARPLTGSEELVEQARMVLKGHGDFWMLYHDDGVKAGGPANGKTDQQGRRPGPDRKRARFTVKAPESKAAPVIDRSKVLKIKDPNVFFKTMDGLEEAEKEIRRLKGEVVDDQPLDFDTVHEPKRRSTLPGRKSVRTFKLIDDADTQDPIEVPASQTGTVTESQLSEDDAHPSVAGKKEQSVPSRSGQRAISDVSEKEDSLAEKDDLTYLLTSFENLDGPEEEEFLRKTLGIEKKKMGKIHLWNSIPGGRSLRSNTVRKNSMRVPPPERPLSRNCQSRISELEKHLFPGDAANHKCADLPEDDESEGSPDIVMGEQSLVNDPSDVLMTDDTFTTSEIDKETLNPGVKAADHAIDPEPNMPDCADERQAGGSPLGLHTASEYHRETPNLGVKAAEHFHDPEPSMPDHADERQAEGSTLGLCSDTEVAKEKATCSRNNISMEGDNEPIDYPIDISNNETEVSSSHHLEGSSAEVLVRTPIRNVASDGIDRTSHAAEDNIQHLEVVEEDGVIQDKSSHPSGIPLKDIDPANQSQKHGRNIKKLATDLRNALSPTKEKKQQAAKKGKKKQQSKGSQKGAGESNHPLEISQANFDSENQPHMDEDTEQETVVTSNSMSPNKAKGQKGAQRSNRTKQLSQRKSLGDAGLAWQSGVRRSTRIRSRPLEHWLGERFVYGRIHDTMATVIGIKAYSPGQDGKKTLKVKSFVPEQYSDLVTESAKY